VRVLFTKSSPGLLESRLRPRRLGVTRRPLLALLALAAAGAIAAGCGSSSGSSSSGGTTPATTSGGASSGGGGYGGGGASTTTPTGAATVKTATTNLGAILVDGSGRTLYLFEKDQPNQSACSGACVAAWPVDRSSGAPQAAGGARAALLGTIRRGDGSTQVTYNRHPLYYYAGDSAAGQQNGQGLNAFGATWFVVAPAGGRVT